MGVKFNETLVLNSVIDNYAFGQISYKDVLLFSCKQTDEVTLKQNNSSGENDVVRLHIDQAIQLRDFLNQVLVD